MSRILCLALVALFAVAVFAEGESRFPGGALKQPVITQDLVNEINELDTTWTAGLNRGSVVAGKSLDEVRRLMGVLPGGPELVLKRHEVVGDFPDHFDARDEWPDCETIGQIRDQSACGSCWAFGAAEAMSDRMCIALGQNVALSAADMAFCCTTTCGYGCNGGYPNAAWQYWVSNGLVEEACYPYPFPSCENGHLPSSTQPCPRSYPTPSCPNKCTNSSYSGPIYSKGKHFGASAYSLKGEAQIQAEILKNGPVEVAFMVYADFMTYKSGVYSHKTGGFLGGHAVKMLGWGVENGTPYWLCANSWNTNWGDKGYFKIKRGSNECGIEDRVSAGLPKN